MQTSSASTIRERVEEAGSGLDTHHTLPADWYTDPEIFEAERTAIFARTWQYVGPLDHVQNAGDYFTATIARTPVVVTRAADGELHAHVNICRHRGHEVVQGRGNVRALKCPYHAWTYGLDGALRSAPRSRDDTSFDRCDWALLPAAVMAWGPMVFVNLDAGAPPPESALTLLGEYLTSAGLDLSELRCRERTTLQLAANWKVAMENYVECYHCAPTHPEFCTVMSTKPGVLKTDVNDTLLSLVTPLLPGVLDKRDALPYSLDGEVTEGQFHALFPLSTFSMYPGRGNLQVGAWMGVDAHRTTKFTDWFYAEGMTAEAMAKMKEFVLLVAEQDTGIVESVQRGWESGRMHVGRVLAVEQEGTTQRFQQLVHQALAGEKLDVPSA